MGGFLGRPGGRKVCSRHKDLATCSCQLSSPKGCPRTTDRRTASTSASVWGWFTRCTQSAGTGTGQGCSNALRRSPSLACRCPRLDQRQCLRPRHQSGPQRVAFDVAQHRVE